MRKYYCDIKGLKEIFVVEYFVVGLLYGTASLENVWRLLKTVTNRTCICSYDPIPENLAEAHIYPPPKDLCTLIFITKIWNNQ